ncbi:hypothetical protein O181_015761 [Austropuccinia psidii MF-1]|uniref:Peptidase A2 domain-containing protein n=1 Tax=Austropuccinia psidii MF-1 TaxID=1389203 RepID=A0A9Q3C4C5_9BASI|nr:hypothetical protein [Austropuccinia psidii MF-1]
MQIFAGKAEYPVMEVVNTGSEVNIIREYSAIKDSPPNKKLHMNLTGIGGYAASLIELAALKELMLPPGEGKEIHFFIAKGAVHTVLGRSFFAKKNI